jgi:hypothetical protein
VLWQLLLGFLRFYLAFILLVSDFQRAVVYAHSKLKIDFFAQDLFKHVNMTSYETSESTHTHIHIYFFNFDKENISLIWVTIIDNSSNILHFYCLLSYIINSYVQGFTSFIVTSTPAYC